MSSEIDCRGLACPQPVLITKRALDSLTKGVIVSVVDNQAAKENVVKLATSIECGVSVEEADGCFRIRITKDPTRIQKNSASASPAVNAPVYLITQDTLGHGSVELGAILIKSFFTALAERNPLPRAILFLNSGVRLTVEESPVLSLLAKLAEQGVDIASCGTCLDFYQLKEKLVVGSISNMYSIIAELEGEGKTIVL